MNETQLEEALRAAIGNKAPGVAVVIVGRDGVRARLAVGTADVISHRPMATDIAFPWFSMTKIATATATIRLAERGVFDLDEPVASLVPAMRLLLPAS